MIRQGIKEDQLWNMDDTGFIKKKNYQNVVVLKVSSNVWSKCANKNFHMNFVVCFSLLNLL